MPEKKVAETTAAAVSIAKSSTEITAVIWLYTINTYTCG